MRIENEYFVIVIERKERKPGMPGERQRISKMQFGQAGSVLAGLFLTIMLAVSGGRATGGAGDLSAGAATKETVPSSGKAAETENETGGERVEGSYVASLSLATSAQEKYREQSLYGYDYGEPVHGLKRDEGIEIQLGFDVEKSGIEKWTEVGELFSDPELSQRRSCNFSYDSETGTLSFLPWHEPYLDIGMTGLSTEQVAEYDHGSNSFFEKDSGTDWGNQGTMYLALYKDLKTGRELARPIVRVVNLVGEIRQAPKVSFSIAEDGRASLSWKPVEGAEKYFICQRWGESGYSSSMLTVVGQTEETSWMVDAAEYGMFTQTNALFRHFDVCEDDWYEEFKAESARERYGIESGAYCDESDDRASNYCVIAVSKEGTSMASNFIRAEDVAANLPYSFAFNTNRENGYSSWGYSTVEELMSYGYVTMCDGHTLPKVIDYKTEEARVVRQHYINVDPEDGSYQGSMDAMELQIPFVIEGTPFADTAAVQDYNEENLEKDLKAIEEREDMLRKRSGNVEHPSGEDTDEEFEADQEVRRLEDVEITANSALSEYLAASMLGGAAVIDLSAFPEASDKAVVADAWQEAYNQNPLILGVSGYRLSKKGTTMKVLYDNTAQEQAGKQEVILQKISQITAEIITEDMTDLEKEFAINQYLCDTITYDEDALANAEKYDFKRVDEEYYDSFSAYGALINGKCVCAGYAAAFKLLAGEAGLDAVVVTGFLEGSLSHAWNKVCIDGQWEIVDVTNNDNEYLFNALLNLPEYAGERVLVEDKGYVLDNCLSEYEATGEEDEYYRFHSMYFDEENIAGELADELLAKGSATLRTEYDLDDERFEEIAGEVYDIIGEDKELYGSYWMGVIYLTLEEPE